MEVGCGENVTEEENTCAKALWPQRNGGFRTGREPRWMEHRA